MLKLSVPDMSCEHCVATITKAVRTVDAAATVAADLPSNIVSVDTQADRAEVMRVLKAAGYPATAQ